MSVGAVDVEQGPAPRTGVGRSILFTDENANGVDFSANVRVRGLVKVSLMTTLAAASTNLRLRYNSAYNDGLARTRRVDTAEREPP